MVLPSVPSAPTLWGWKAPGAPRRPETAPGQRSPPVALFLQQAPQGLQVPHVGGVVQPRVLAVLQRVVTELLPQPLLQIRTCTEERGACQLRAALPGHQQGAPPTQERVSLQSAPLVAAPRTAARQAPLSTERCRQEYWRCVAAPFSTGFFGPRD